MTRALKANYRLPWKKLRRHGAHRNTNLLQFYVSQGVTVGYALQHCLDSLP